MNPYTIERTNTIKDKVIELFYKDLESGRTQQDSYRIPKNIAFFQLSSQGKYGSILSRYQKSFALRVKALKGPKGEQIFTSLDMSLIMFLSQGVNEVAEKKESKINAATSLVESKYNISKAGSITLIEDSEEISLQDFKNLDVVINYIVLTEDGDGFYRKKGTLREAVSDKGLFLFTQNKAFAPPGGTLGHKTYNTTLNLAAYSSQIGSLAFTNFLSILEDRASVYFTLDSKKEENSKKLELLNTYWTGLERFIDLNSLEISDIEVDRVQKARNLATRIDDNLINRIESISKVKKSRESKILSRIRTQIDTNIEKIIDLDTSTSNLSIEIENIKSQNELVQEYYEQFLNNDEIGELTEESRNYVKEGIEKFLSVQEGRQQSLDQELQEKCDSINQYQSNNAKLHVDSIAIDQKIQRMIDANLESNNKTIATNLEETGILLTFAEYKNKKDDSVVLLTDNVDVISDNNYYLHRLGVMTTKPMRIFVDANTLGADAPCVVGGPYELEVSIDYNASTDSIGRPKMILRLAGMNSVFGSKKDGLKNLAKIHPHTQSSEIMKDAYSLKRFFNSSHNVCLGELSSMLTEAFVNQDINHIMLCALSWLKSTNTKKIDGEGEDAYGVTWNWFPNSSFFEDTILM